MKLTIKCPKCGHRFRTVVGIIVTPEPVRTRYYLNYDYIGFPQQYFTFKKLKESGRSYTYFCKSCGEVYPKEMQKEIDEYLRKRKLLDKLRSN